MMEMSSLNLCLNMQTYTCLVTKHIIELHQIESVAEKRIGLKLSSRYTAVNANIVYLAIAF